MAAFDENDVSDDTDLRALTEEYGGEYKTYEYDDVWKDKLTCMDGYDITYDEIGNPVSYFKKTLTWDGRSLTSFGNVTYEYDENGIRTKKENTSKYGDTVTYETDEENYRIMYIYIDQIMPSRIRFDKKYLPQGYLDSTCGYSELEYSMTGLW